MITITPQGRVYLCKTPLENDYKNQLTFSNATNQLNYFTSKVVKNLSDEDFTYIKKDNVLKVGLPIDEIIDCNYLFYQNTGFTTKYYYCFITDMEYINENCTAITFETDVYQTYMFDIVKKTCFVEREHVNDDTFGNNTVPEGLDTGEFIINECDEFTRMDLTYNIVGVSRPQTDTEVNSIYGGSMNGIYTGLSYYVFPDETETGKFIKAYDRIGHGDNIVVVFALPQNFFSGQTFSTLTVYNDSGTAYGTMSGARITDRSLPTEFIRKTINKNTTLNGYTPKNNKLFTGEFNYLYVTNNAGTDVKYNYEDFVSEPHFKIDGVICVGGSIKLMPTNYKKYDCLSPNTRYSWSEFCYGLTCAKYPTCSWSNDAYTNWLTQNATNFLVEDIKFGYSQFSNLPDLEGGGFEKMTSGGEILANSIGHYLDRMALKKSYSFMPTQAKGSINAGDITLSEGAIGFWYYKMSVKYEYAKRIDDFLSAFGYKVNEFKIPNTTGRLNWNYVKTIGCNFEGDIPQIYLNKIKQIFNSGITLWHNASTMFDYSQSNTIVS